MNRLRWRRSLSELDVAARLIAGSHVHGIRVRIGRWRANRAGETSVLLLPLGHNLSCVEFYEHCAIRLQFFDGNGQSEVVQKEELKFQVVQLHQWKTANLHIQ